MDVSFMIFDGRRKGETHVWIDPTNTTI
jgi:hypothetical protein